MLFLTMVLLLAAVPDHSLGEEAEAKKATGEEEKKKATEEDEDEEEDEITSSGVSLKMQKIIVDKHNEIRRQVQPTAANMLKMVWNETVGEMARKWAEQCILASSPPDSRKLGSMECGENIFQSNNLKAWQDVVDFWLSGKDYFKYGTGATDPRKNIFGYTQLIWYNSYIVGCSVAYCEHITFPNVYVCHYCPGGNLMSQISKPYKDGPSCGDCPNNCEDKLCTNPCEHTDISRDCKSMKSMFTCKNASVKENCKATCFCKKNIS